MCRPALNAMSLSCVLLILVCFAIECRRFCGLAPVLLNTDQDIVSLQVQQRSPHQMTRRTTIAGGVDLKILPLGDSITWGEGSGDGNGYRQELLNELSGNKVEYIGGMHSGSMQNNANEGHRGFPIGPVGNTGKPNYPQRPNVILLMAGTNDIVLNLNVQSAPESLGKVIAQIVAACFDAAVLVATIPPFRDPEREKMRVTYNAALPAVVAKHANANKQVALVDMSRITADHINATDKIHPVDEGYKIMASAWYEAIQGADHNGWIKSPLRPVSSLATPSRQIRQPGWGPIFAGVCLLAIVAIFLARKRTFPAIRRYTLLPQSG